jgi:hypothetical protein
MWLNLERSILASSPARPTRPEVADWRNPKHQLAVANPRLPQATLRPLDQPRAFCKAIVKTADASLCRALPGQKPKLRSPVLQHGGVAVAGQGNLFGPACPPMDLP